MDFILPSANPVRMEMRKIRSISQVVELEKMVESLLSIHGSQNLYWIFNSLYKEEPHQPHGGKTPKDIEEHISSYFKDHFQEISIIKKNLDRYFSSLFNNYDKVLFIDLCRVAVDSKGLSGSLLEKIGNRTLGFYRDASASSVHIGDVVRSMTKELFHEIHFKTWRKTHEKEFLKSKRLEEKVNKIYPKPYLDYLNRAEEEMFQDFWNLNKWNFLTAFLTGKHEIFSETELTGYLQHLLAWHEELQKGAHQVLPWREKYQLLKNAVALLSLDQTIEYLKTLRGYADLNRPLLGRYRSLRKEKKNQIEKHLAAGFYPAKGFGYGRSQAYRQATTQGSLFKLVTSYEALTQRYQSLIEIGASISPASLNPLDITDHIFKKGKELCVGYTQDDKPIPQLYKGGRLLKSVSRNLGKLDLLKAIETSSNPYFSLLAGDVLNSPKDLEKAARNFGYGACTGIDIPLEISGKMPADLETNRTGLYAMANGQHSLVVTPLQTSVMLSAIANKGKVLKPKIVSLTAGRQFNEKEDHFQSLPNFPYEESLGFVGIDFPLFSAIHRRGQNRKVEYFPTVVRQELFMPDLVQRMLLEGMRRVVQKQVKDGLSHLSRIYREYPEAISDLIDLKDQMLGKTSTSEVLENLSLDIENGTQMINHVWFGAVAYPQNVIDHDYETLLYKNEVGEPELIVVVYLRYGAWGKEAAPIGAQIIKKWREIKSKS